VKLADLLAEMDRDDIDRLAHEHARADEDMPPAQLLSTIEGVLKSHRFLQDFLVNRQPPMFAIAKLLLDAPNYELPVATFRDAVTEETSRICAAIDAGEILARNDQLRLYRKVLYQARSNDLMIDDSESAILGVLRDELEVAQVEHFLIEHHSDLREFWRRDEAFVREMNALRSAGIIHIRDGKVILPEDLVRAVQLVLGIDMPGPSARRLFGHLSNNELRDALGAVGAPTSGSKEERIERLVAHMTQTRTVLRLRSTALERLREVCKDVGAQSSGAKEEVVDRLVKHFAANRDLHRESEAPPPPVQEPRHLDEAQFLTMFLHLRGQELGAILAEFELRRLGPKAQQIQALWGSHLSEESLLAALSNPDLEGILRRVNLKPNGPKPERIRRLIDHFSGSAPHTEVAPAEG
jgi:hypothetical protein